ncbi:MAG TPA: queuosine salvage family protein [Ktedonobacterales bacterium]|nr:queuosine salvage family protein [Ktedonobacterales bacterium]
MTTYPPDLPLTPPAADALGVLTGTATPVREGTLVTLDGEAVTRLAERWAGQPWPTGDVASDFAAMHFRDGGPRTANWMLLVDALNFCFWGEPREPRWTVEWRGKLWDGYYALAAALTRAMDEGVPLADAAYLAEMTAEQLGGALRPAPGYPPIPLFDERLANAREVGRVLSERYNGQMVHVVAAAGYDAVALALLLARDFPSFADIAEWDEQPVPFLKRAQICVGDLHTAFGGVGNGAIHGIERLTAFADYKLPQTLRREVVLVYEPELAELIADYTLIPPGSDAEVEIRAATVWAVELLRRTLEDRGIQQTASAIDYRIWLESQAAPPDNVPYHRTRTIYY